MTVQSVTRQLDAVIPRMLEHSVEVGFEAAVFGLLVSNLAFYYRSKLYRG